MANTGKALSAQEVLEQLNANMNGITTPQQLMEEFRKLGVGISSGQEINGGFLDLEDDQKATFLRNNIGQPVFLATWEFKTTQFGPQAEIKAITDAGKYVFRDSGTGICRQLAEITRVRTADTGSNLLPTAGLLLQNGFRVSDAYYVDKETRQAIPTADLDKYPADKRMPGMPIWYLAL